MSSTPDISVIIPVYNTGRYLEKSLSSVLRQTLQDIEVIAVNDGSTDNSSFILKEFSSKDRRFKVINFDKNHGVSAARNAGIDKAQGKWLYFLDSDDWLDRAYLESMLHEAETYSLKMVSNLSISAESEEEDCQSTPAVNFWYSGYNREKTGFIASKTLKNFSLPVVWAKLFQRGYIISNRIKFPESLRVAEDFVFCGVAELLQKDSFVFQGPPIHYLYRKSSLWHNHSHNNNPVNEIIASGLLFHELSNRNIDTRGVKLFEPDPSIAIDTSETFNSIYNVMKDIKTTVMENIDVYTRWAIFFMDSILSCSGYPKYQTKFPKTLINHYIRISHRW